MCLQPEDILVSIRNVRSIIVLKALGGEMEELRAWGISKLWKGKVFVQFRGF